MSVRYVREHGTPYGEMGVIRRGSCSMCAACEGDEICWDGDSYYYGCPMLDDPDDLQIVLVDPPRKEVPQ